MIQAHIFISGRVQGVRFRYFIQQNAQDLGVAGWVKNLPDGRVEALFQGEAQDIKRIVELCKKGPPLALVTNINIEWDEVEEPFENFITLRS